MKLKEALKHLKGYYFIRDKQGKCICTNHKDYLDNQEKYRYPKVTNEILKQYEDYEIYEIDSAYDGWSESWITLYIYEEKN
jgi:hypothetical protein